MGRSQVVNHVVLMSNIIRQIHPIDVGINVTHLDLVSDHWSVIENLGRLPRQEDISIGHGLHWGAVGASRNVAQNHSDGGGHLAERVASNNLVKACIGRSGGVERENGPAVFGVNDAQPVNKLVFLISKFAWVNHSLKRVALTSTDYLKIFLSSVLHLRKKSDIFMAIHERKKGNWCLRVEASNEITWKLDYWPRVFHEDEVVLKPMYSRFGLSRHQARQLQRFSFRQSNILGLLTEERKNAINYLAGNCLLQMYTMSL